MQNTTIGPLRLLSNTRLKSLALLGGLLLPMVVSVPNAVASEAREPAEVYRQICAHCHALDKAVGPEITMAFPETAHEAWGNYIRTTVRNGRGAMPSFREAKVSDEELDALIQALMYGEFADTAEEE
ncbi:cytochrome c [Vreelandella rituensis]|nr:cytochrome c [Halomonas rituensis]